MISVIVFRRQGGSVLIISLVMLMVLTMLAISAINMSTIGLRTVNGMQARGDALSAAQRVVEQIINANFTTDIGSIAKVYTVDIDAGKSVDVLVATPCLKQMRSIPNTELKLTVEEDLKCYDTSTNPWSACADTVWEFSASVNEGFFGANVGLRQGVSIRMDNASAIAYQTGGFSCP